MTNVSIFSTDDIQTKPLSPGEMLRVAREAQGLHISALAVYLKVPVSKIEALESDRYDLLSDIVFVRALTASVCRVLKISSLPILSLLPPSETPCIKTNNTGLNTTFENSSKNYFYSILNHKNKLFYLLILFILLSLVILYFYLFNINSSYNILYKYNIEKPIINKNSSDANSFSSNNQGIDRLRSKSIDSLVEPPVNSIIESTEVKSLPDIQSVIPSASSVDALKPTQHFLVNKNILNLKAKGVSWVEVIDADGIIQLSKTLLMNESLVLSGRLPLKVVLGRADMVEVNVRDQAFNITDFTKNNVARFEVN